MGENKHIKELDTFAKKYIKEIKQEKPSLDFTVSIMQTIAKETISEVFKPKVLISKKVWFAVAVLVFIALFIPFKGSQKKIIHLPEFNFSFLDKIQFPNVLEIFSVSNTVLYAVVFFGLMFIAQVVFLKNHFNKRFD